MDRQHEQWVEGACLPARSLGTCLRPLAEPRRCIMVVTCVFRHNSRCEKLAEPPRFVALQALRRYPGGKPATACCSGPSVRFAPHLYQQQTGLLQAARTWCQLLRVRVAAVSSVCVLPRHRCRDRGWDRGGDRAQQRWV